MFRNIFLNFSYVSIVAVVFVMAVSTTCEIAYAEAEYEEEVFLNVEGMAGYGCENVVRAALLAVDGVKKADVSHKDGTAVVQVEGGKARVNELVQAVEKTGFSAEEVKK